MRRVFGASIFLGWIPASAGMTYEVIMFETIDVIKPEVACDGGTPALGHPRVFLHIDHETGRITCPYCSRTYVLKHLKPQSAA